MRRGGWSGPMVSSVQRTEVADVASLFIGCDMKKRSACKILPGALMLGLLGTGYCGEIELVGTHSGTVTMSIELNNPDGMKPRHENGIGIECRLCRTVHGPCIGTVPRTVHMVSRNNVKYVRTSQISAKHVTAVVWQPVVWDRENWVRVNATCDNHEKPGWMLVDLGFHRGSLLPQNALTVTATNVESAETTRYVWGRTSGGTWYTKWGNNVIDSTGRPASVRFTYADKVELQGKGAKARVLYDVVGTAPVTARIDQIPNELSCARTPDGLIIESGGAADVGTGESITCTNARHKVGIASDTLSVTAMIR